jgi:ribulose-bisphosphate carboxylase large chain
VCEAFWQAGDFIKEVEPQGNRVTCQMNDSIPEVIEAMRACVKKTAASKLFSANVTVDDPVERSLVASMSVADRPLGPELRLLVDGCVGGGTAITVARRNFPE